MRVLHVITSLDRGGAESMLLKLARACRDHVEAGVVGLMADGEVGERLRELDIPVEALGAVSPLDLPASLYRLRRRVREFHPDVVQSWMYHADLLAGLATRGQEVALAWGIRHSDLHPATTKRSTWLIARACASRSRVWPDAIVCCSEASRRTHVELGYAADRMVTIPNGFDMATFHPSEESAWSVRAELGVPRDSLLVGMVARFHPQKDHATFIEAARLISTRLDVHFVLCGRDVTPTNPTLQQRVEAAGLVDRVHLLGPREDIPRLTAALDVAVSSACAGEGFPNVVGEAMACAVPCVVTDVGDSAEIVGDTGITVEPGDAAALAAACERLLRMTPDERRELGARARCRVRSHYEIGEVATRYRDLWEDMAREGRRIPASLGHKGG